MNIATSIIVFIMVWWIVLFAVLPWGVERVKHPEKGHDAGAPKSPSIKKKLLITTLIALVITTVYIVALTHGYLAFLKIRG